MTVPTPAIDVLPDDRRDRKLIKLLLAHLARLRGLAWTSLDFPEDRIRTRDAVQVIAMEQSGRMTAVEHVALDGFAGDTQDATRFLPAFDALERDPSLRLPGFHVDLAVPVDAVPNAVDARLLASSVRGWCERHVRDLAPGHSSHVIMVSRAPVKIQIEKSACPGEAGGMTVTRTSSPGNFEAVVHESLKLKLPRLIAAAADRKAMLFEKLDGLWSLSQLRLELQGASLEFPDLNGLSEIWFADTAGRAQDGPVVFRLVLQNYDE